MIRRKRTRHTAGSTFLTAPAAFPEHPNAGATLDQRDHDSLSPVKRRPVQRRAPVRVPSVHNRHALLGNHASFDPRPRCRRRAPHKKALRRRRRSRGIFGQHPPAAIDQRLHGARGARVMERRLPRSVARVDVGSRVDESTHHVGIAAGGCPVKRRAALL